MTEIVSDSGVKFVQQWDKIEEAIEDGKFSLGSWWRQEEEKSSPDVVDIGKIAVYDDPSNVPDTSLDKDQLTTLESTLFEAYKQQVWPWDLTKAPEMWAGDDEVPDFVKGWIDDVIEEMDPMWHKGFDNIPHAAAIQVHEEIADSLTQPQGWSTKSIANRIQDEFEWLDQDHAEVIARQEVAAILNKSREAALKARPDFDQMVFDWEGPDDAYTTKVCEETKEAIEDMGGAVTLDTLKDILMDKAQEYADRGGTPERVEEWVPHFQCRHTLVERDLEDLKAKADVWKERVYIDDILEVPEGATVHEGPRGGLYYDREAMAFAEAQMEADRERMEEYGFSDEQISEAAQSLQRVNEKSNEIFASWMAEVNDVANIVGGSHRTKALGSALEKVYGDDDDDDDKYDEIEDLTDMHGSKVKVETVPAAREAFEQLQEEFDVIKAKDKMDDGPYRAFHLVAEVEGEAAELQIHQEELSKIADASHTLSYKAEQEAPVDEMDTLDSVPDEELQDEIAECLEQQADFMVGQTDEVDCDPQAMQIIDEFYENFT